ncbi:hypothetical protein ACFZC5_35095 [Nocardia gamkensis]|uniref:hypothetical protein n=1 Tax=Nocardia gamkensis TaxID=352869 RepID=UPI0036E52692
MVIVRPPAAVVHCARSGQHAHASAKQATPVWRPIRAAIGAVTPAGHLTIRVFRSIVNRSLEKCPFADGDGCTLIRFRIPLSSNHFSNSPASGGITEHRGGVVVPVFGFGGQDVGE